MSDAEHLIENVIMSLVGDGAEEELNHSYNIKMLEATNIDKEDLIRMACHVVYSLYEGLNPFGKYFDEVMEYYYYLKEYDHAPKYTWGDAVQILIKIYHCHLILIMIQQMI